MSIIAGPFIKDRRLKILALLVLLFSFQAVATDIGHFLYPRDLKALQISGLEQLTSRARANLTWKKCDGKIESTIDATLCEILEESLGGWREADKTFWDEETNLIFFGERHIDVDIQLMMNSLLPSLYEAGYRTLALEMINKENQNAIDLFLNNEMTIDDFMNVFKKDWSYNSVGYQEMILTAKKLGMKIIGLDEREKAPADFSYDLIRRDQIMADVINDQFEKYPDEKIIAYTGRLHGYQVLSTRNEDVPTIAENVLFKNNFIKSESYFFVGKKESSLFKDLRKFLEVNQVRTSQIIKIPYFNPYVNGIIFTE
jgi:hypothetical protein